MNAELLNTKFWDRVTNLNEPDKCWIYEGAQTPNGYGHTFREGKDIYAHRLVWELAAGPIPEFFGDQPACVMHSCDNPSCVNPAHLLLGNMRLNIADRDAKGRGRPGGRRPRTTSA